MRSPDSPFVRGFRELAFVRTSACLARSMLHPGKDTMHHSRTDEGTTTILRVRGELDALSAPHLRTVLEGLIEDQRYDITVDLLGLRLIDSCGIGTLVWLYKQVRARGGVVRFVGVTAQPLVIFKLLRLDIVFGLAEPGSNLVCGPGTQELEPVEPRASESAV